jgi:hypothetical protein
MMLEAELQAKVLDLCKKYRLRVFHSTDSRRDIGPGWPDLIIVGKSLLAVELKQQYTNLSGMQTTWKYALKAAGIAYYLWRPSDLTDGIIEIMLKSIAV